jgi:predicted RNase H-like HicB family nuclease
MHNEFTAIVEKDGPWYIAYCAEVPGANGQGKTRDECLGNLREAVALILGPIPAVGAAPARGVPPGTP